MDAIKKHIGPVATSPDNLSEASKEDKKGKS